MESLTGLGCCSLEGHLYQQEINGSENSPEKLSLADLMQFADFGPGLGIGENLGKSRKRARSRKTSEQVESQRMTHIAVERNRRRRMNEHLCILRSLMPTSYVQRGDQASIVGGAIEFVRELEQLAQCLESRKMRRDVNVQTKPSENRMISEEKAEVKSCLANVEVKLLGVDGSIRILSRTRPGQLIKTIAALEDLELNIVHANVTTVDRTALYSFDFKMNGGALRFTAEDIAKSAQQILCNFISK